jgi:hypothetical protein
MQQQQQQRQSTPLEAWKPPVGHLGCSWHGAMWSAPLQTLRWLQLLSDTAWIAALFGVLTLQVLEFLQMEELQVVLSA